MLRCILFLSLLFAANCANWKPRFEYKYSFKGPHLVQSDKSVPFWEYSGDAIASDENIRITPSLRSKKGMVWAKNPTSFEMWSVEMVFKITGRGRVGADGMALWFTDKKGVDGPVFGSNDQWNGLGVFMDSFDNDGQHNNPYVMAMVNDGSRLYEHQNEEFVKNNYRGDGINQQVGGCLRDFRNKPYPVRVKVEYYNKILTVFMNNGLTNNKDDFELCLRQDNVELPKSGYFGISAATGGLADDHDVLAFLTHSLIDMDQQPDVQQVSDQDREKYEKEFDAYYKELEQAKQDYQKQHPDKHVPDIDAPGMFESQSERELKMIFDGQTQMHTTLKMLNRKLDELLGRQEMVLSKIGQLPSGQIQQPQGGQQGQQGGGQAPMIETIRRHEVDRVFNNQNEIMQNAREIRNIINDVQQKAGYIQSNVAGGGGAAGGAALSPEIHNLIQEMSLNVRNLKTDTGNLLQRPAPGAGGANCPPPVETSCVSPSLFFVAIAGQIFILLGFMIYRQSKEAQAKKFY